MNVADYIVNFFIEKGITDVFGYPGGMVTYLMESFRKYSPKIKAHINYHEQAAAFSACGYAQISGKTGVAFATSGPGATNLITGICNAYFDSIPIIFITGQVNTYEKKQDYERQRGFQETDIISMVKGVTKYSMYIKDAKDIRFCLEKAYYMANEGRLGPVILDIPMDIQRKDIDNSKLHSFNQPPVISKDGYADEVKELISLIKDAKRPCIIAGAAVKSHEGKKLLNEFVEKFQIPVVTSMIAVDVLNADNSYNYGFIGAYGGRAANLITVKSDLIIAMGTRLDIRQVGLLKEKFAPNSKLVRIDIDKNELNNKIKNNELQIAEDLKKVLKNLLDADLNENKFSKWNEICKSIKKMLQFYDDKKPNEIIRKISELVSEDIIITTDVGQNQVWIAQAFKVKGNQQILFSGGHGAMGYSLPAAIGAYYGLKKPILCVAGDGGFQMNIQELQFIVREQLPITIIVLNNYSLGMIRHFQEMYFESNYTKTIENEGYSVPKFKDIALAYGLKYFLIKDVEDVKCEFFDFIKPTLVEVDLNYYTYVFPKLEYGREYQEQEPQLEAELYNKIINL